MSKRCPVCSAKLADAMTWFLHVSNCTAKPAQTTQQKKKSGDWSLPVGPMQQRTDGHKSWVRGQKPGCQTKMSRLERIHLYADNARRNDRGVIVAPLADLGGEHRVLYGVTKLDQEGIAAKLIAERKALRNLPRAQRKAAKPAGPTFGTGVL